MTNNWLDKNEYPFNLNSFNVNGHKMNYIDEGHGAIILFIHGTPSWSFDYRNIIKKLSNHYRCIATDHIGFGLSDKPGSYDYSTVNHSATLTKFILEKDLKNITLVVHDFGGPIGLNFAIQHPERVKNIVVLNSWLWCNTADPDFMKLSKILKSPLLPWLYLNFNFSPRFILPQSFGAKKITRRLLHQYTSPFAKKSERYGALAFAKSLLNDQLWFEELWNQRSKIDNKPILFIWGMKDKVIKPHYLEKFVSGFQFPVVKKLSESGHFPQEEEPEKITQWINEFMAD